MSEVAVVRPPKKYSVKRSRIIAAGTQVLNHQGTRGFTLVAVARLMEMHPVSLTYYFKTREDLFAACLMSTIERFSQMMANAQVKGAMPAERVTAFIANYFEARREVALGRQAMLASFSEMKRIHHPTSPVIQAFGGMLRDMQALFGHDTDRIRRAARSRLLMEGLSWTRGWIDLYAPDDYPRIAASLTDIILRGVPTPELTWPAVTAYPLGEGGDVAQRDRFLTAATALINRHGYDGASVEQISSHLNLTKGSFYHHHTQKEDLLVACFERTFDLLREAQAKAVGETGWERVCSAANALILHQRDEDGGGFLRSYAIAALPADMRPQITAKYRDAAARFAGLISDGVDDGSIRPVDPFIASQVVIGTVNAASFFGSWVKGGDDVDLVEALGKPGLMGLIPQA